MLNYINKDINRGEEKNNSYINVAINISASSLRASYQQSKQSRNNCREVNWGEIKAQGVIRYNYDDALPILSLYF